jgi:hypothetical protein
LIIAPAQAGKNQHRWNERKNNAHRRANDLQARGPQQLQQAEDAQRRAAEAQKRVQQMQEALASHQRRLQQLQQNALPQKAINYIQQRIQQTEALQRRLQLHQAQPPPSSLTRAGTDHQRAVMDAMAKIRARYGGDRGDERRTNNAGQERPSHHQLLFQSVMQKVRGPASGGWQHNDRQRNNWPNHAADTHRPHGMLKYAMDKFRHRDHEQPRHWSHGYGSHHGEMHRQIWAKLGHKWRGKQKQETVAENNSSHNSENGNSSHNKGKGSGGSLLDTSTVTTPAATLVAKLPDVASGGSNDSSSRSDNGMSRLGGPREPKADKASDRAADKPDRDDGPGSLKQAGRPLGGRVVGELLPEPGTFQTNEVLAINISPSRLQKAVERQFKIIDKIELPALGVSVTRLETPAALGAVIGRNTLYEMFPDDGFGLNRIYTAGRPAGTQAVKSAAVPAPPGPGGAPVRPGAGCTPERCFGIKVINWQPQLAACARGIRIGVIDTGLDKAHPAFVDLTPDRFQHKVFIAEGAKPAPNQHGTGILSLLAGSVRSGTPGLVPDATFLVGDAFFADRSGNAMSDTYTMLKALNWLKGAKVDVANLSFAGPKDDLVHDAITKLARTGTVILAAAGNEGQDAPPSYPAAYEEVIAVTAVDRNLAPYMYASRGNHIAVAAPGVDVWTALPNRREGPQSGTSFAVPFATSVVALTYRTDSNRTQYDPLEPRQRALALLQKDIRSIGGRGRSPIYGAGLVQAPSHCEPKIPGAVASAGPAGGNGWAGTVQHVAPARPQGGLWTSTVHPVAKR